MPEILCPSVLFGELDDPIAGGIIWESQDCVILGVAGSPAGIVAVEESVLLLVFLMPPLYLEESLQFPIPLKGE